MIPANHPLNDSTTKIIIGENLELKITDLQDIRTAGGGNFGAAYSCRYMGSDPEIQKYCTRIKDRDGNNIYDGEGNPIYYLVLKEPKRDEFGAIDENNKAAFNEEQAITSQLCANKIKEQQSEKYGDYNSSFNLAEKACMIIKKEDGSQETSPMIISQFEYFDVDSEMHPIANNGLGFLKENISNPLFTEDQDILLMGFIANAHQSLSDFHETGFLHLDLSLRNLLMNIKWEDQKVISLKPKLADYGFVKNLMNNPAAVIENGQTKIKENHTGPFPLLWTSTNRLKEGLIDQNDDIFGFKITLFELVHMVTGVNRNGLIAVFDERAPFADKSVTDIIMERDKLGDSTAINNGMKNIERLVYRPGLTPDRIDNKSVLTNMLPFFQKYLSGQTQLANEDKALFNDGLHQFFKKTINEKIAKSENNSKLLLSIKRLMEIPFDTTLMNAKEKNIYDKMKEIANYPLNAVEDAAEKLSELVSLSQRLSESELKSDDEEKVKEITEELKLIRADYNEIEKRILKYNRQKSNLFNLRGEEDIVTIASLKELKPKFESLALRLKELSKFKNELKLPELVQNEWYLLSDFLETRVQKTFDEIKTIEQQTTNYFAKRERILQIATRDDLTENEVVNEGKQYVAAVNKMANHIIAENKRAFLTIPPEEIFKYSPDKPPPFYGKMIEQQNEFSRYIVADILTQESFEKQSAAIEFWINVAYRLLNHPALNDQMGAMTVLTALTNSSVKIDKNNLISQDARDKFHELENQLSMDFNQAAIKSYLRDHPNTIPFLPYYGNQIFLLSNSSETIELKTENTASGYKVASNFNRQMNLVGSIDANNTSELKIEFDSPFHIPDKLIIPNADSRDNNNIAATPLDITFNYHSPLIKKLCVIKGWEANENSDKKLSELLEVERLWNNVKLIALENNKSKELEQIEVSTKESVNLQAAITRKILYQLEIKVPAPELREVKQPTSESLSASLKPITKKPNIPKNIKLIIPNRIILLDENTKYLKSYLEKCRIPNITIIDEGNKETFLSAHKNAKNNQVYYLGHETAPVDIQSVIKYATLIHKLMPEENPKKFSRNDIELMQLYLQEHTEHNLFFLILACIQEFPNPNDTKNNFRMIDHIPNGFLTPSYLSSFSIDDKDKLLSLLKKEDFRDPSKTVFDTLPQEIKDYLHKNLIFIHKPSDKELSLNLPNKIDDPRYSLGSTNSSSGFERDHVEDVFTIKYDYLENGKFEQGENRIIFKQMQEKNPLTQKTKINIGKNIAQFVAGNIMNALTNDEGISTKFLASTGQDLDESGKDTFVASIHGDELAQVFKVLQVDEPRKERKSLKEFFLSKKIKDALSAEEQDPETHTPQSKYAGFDHISVASLIAGDVAINTGNTRINVSEKDLILFEKLGELFQEYQLIDILKHNEFIEPAEIPDTFKEPLVELLGKNGSDELEVIHLIYEAYQKYKNIEQRLQSAHLYKTDHTGALSKLENTVQFHPGSKHNPLSGNPANQFRDFPTEFMMNPRYAEELLYQADQDLIPTIKRSMETVKSLVGVDALLEFSKFIGMDVKPYEKQNKNNGLKQESLVEDIETYLTVKMKLRQQSCKTLALEIKLSNCIGKDSRFQSVKFTDKKTGKQIEYDIDRLIYENPTYFLKGNFNLHGENQATIIAGRRLQSVGKQRTLIGKINGRVYYHLNELIKRGTQQSDPRIIEHILANKVLKQKCNLNNLQQGYKTILSSLSDNLANLTRMVLLSNNEALKQNAMDNLANRIKTEIMGETHITNRTLILERWLKLMEMANEKGDFLTAQAIHRVVSESPICHLNLTHKSLSSHGQFLLTAKPIEQANLKKIENPHEFTHMEFLSSPGDNRSAFEDYTRTVSKESSKVENFAAFELENNERVSNIMRDKKVFRVMGDKNVKPATISDSVKQEEVIQPSLDKTQDKLKTRDAIFANLSENLNQLSQDLKQYIADNVAFKNPPKRPAANDEEMTSSSPRKKSF